MFSPWNMAERNKTGIELWPAGSAACGAAPLAGFRWRDQCGFSSCNAIWIKYATLKTKVALVIRSGTPRNFLHKSKYSRNFLCICSNALRWVWAGGRTILAAPLRKKLSDPLDETPRVGQFPRAEGTEAANRRVNEFDRKPSEMARAAWLDYTEDLTQSQIVKQLAVSRSTVVRLLQKANQSGLVTFTLGVSTDTFEVAGSEKAFQSRKGPQCSRGDGGGDAAPLDWPGRG